MKNKGVSVVTIILMVGVIAALGFILFSKRDKAPVGQNLLESVSKATTIPSGWLTYEGTGFSFAYPKAILIYPENPPASESVYLTNKVNVTGPREMPEDGIWVQVEVYPASAKDNLITDVQTILSAKSGTQFTHPITPYSEKYIKIKDLPYNGVLIKSSEEKDIKDSREIESALWLSDNKVYQLRIVVVQQSTFTYFEDSFNQMIASFHILK